MSVPSMPAQSEPVAHPRPAARLFSGSYTQLLHQLMFLAVTVGLLCMWFSPVTPSAWRHVLLLTALAVLVGLLPVRLPGHDIITSPVIPIVFAVTGLYGASAGIFAECISTIATVALMLPPDRRTRIRTYLPPLSVQIVAFGASALLYVTLQRYCFPHTGIQVYPGFGRRLGPEWRVWLVLPLCSLLAFVLNALLTTLLASRYSGGRWDIIWHNNARWMLPSALIMSPVGFLTAVLYGQFPWLGIGFIILPVYALRTAVVVHERTIAAYKQGVDLLGRIMQEAHPYTHGHLHRVARWAKKIAEEMNLPASSMQHIEDAAILHDIGKVAVDDRVLNKVGKLTDDDWAMIRRHPVTGADLVVQLSVLDKVSHWIRHHHERPDGKGYPDQLQGDAIPLESSIISVVDAFDAMVGGPAKEDQRPYRQPMTQEAAMDELRRHAGTQFHAGVVEVFIAILLREKEMEATGQHVAPPADLADDLLWASPPQMPAGLSLLAKS